MLLTEVGWQRIMAEESLVRARRFSQDADGERLALLLPFGIHVNRAGQPDPANRSARYDCELRWPRRFRCHPVPGPDLNSCVGPTRMIYSA